MRKPPLKIGHLAPAEKPTFWTAARMGGNDRDVPSLSVCGVLGARQVLRQEIGRTCDGHEGVPRLDLRGSFRVANNLPNERPDWALQVILRSGPGYERGISGLCSFN